MNVPRKWRYLVIAAAGSLAWALSAGLPAAVRVVTNTPQR